MALDPCAAIMTVGGASCVYFEKHSNLGELQEMLCVGVPIGSDHMIGWECLHGPIKLHR